MEPIRWTRSSGRRVASLLVLFNLDYTLCDYTAARRTRLRIALGTAIESSGINHPDLDRVVDESIAIHPHASEHFPVLLAHYGVRDPDLMTKPDAGTTRIASTVWTSSPRPWSFSAQSAPTPMSPKSDSSPTVRPKCNTRRSPCSTSDPKSISRSSPAISAAKSHTPASSKPLSPLADPYRIRLYLLATPKSSIWLAQWMSASPQSGSIAPVAPGNYRSATSPHDQQPLSNSRTARLKCRLNFSKLPYRSNNSQTADVNPNRWAKSGSWLRIETTRHLSRNCVAAVGRHPQVTNRAAKRVSRYIIPSVGEG